MSRAEGNENLPRAMIHRRILDVAESNPEASIPGIADEVSGAAPSLVERVLDEYGDPAADEEGVSEADPEATADETDVESELAESESAEPDDTTMVTENGTTQTTTETDEPTDADVTLSEKQRTTLRAVHGNPDGSQGDIADELDVTRATVSRRLNAIPGFEWSEREAFAESVFGEREPPDAGASESTVATDDESDAGSANDTADGADDAAPTEKRAVEATLTDIDERLSALEADEAGDDSEDDAATLPPELAHKVVHACMESDRVSEDEELELLAHLLAE